MNKRLAIITATGTRDFHRAIVVESRGLQYEWARCADSNLVFFPGAYDEEETYELPETTELIDELVLDLNRGTA